jgi:UDP-glucose 4-epimerase
MSKVLLTGGGGYIGSIATYLLLQKGYDVVVFDNVSTGYVGPSEVFSSKFPSKYTFVKGDLRSDLDSLFTTHTDIDAVLHYAASCSVNESMQDPGKYFSNNVCGTHSLLSAMNKYKITKLVFSSTCAVYGEAEYVPVDEKHPTNPANPYGESKRMVEKMIEWYGKQLDLSYVILRYFNVCGASDDGVIGDSKRPSSLLMQNAVRGALGIEPFFLTCPEVDTPDKTPIRDYINVVDLNEAHIMALMYLEKGGSSEIINLGTGTGNSVRDVISKVQEITGASFDLTQTTPREGEYSTMIADTKKAQKILGWKPTRSLEDSVKYLITWYTNHPKGWDK